MVDFGIRLKELRKEKNLTQKQLATRIGVKNSIISFYEMGDRNPTPEIIIELAKVFHVTTDYLMGVEKEETVSVSGLNDHDKQIIRSLIDTLRDKNEIIKSK